MKDEMRSLDSVYDQSHWTSTGDRWLFICRRPVTCRLSTGDRRWHVSSVIYLVRPFGISSRQRGLDSEDQSIKKPVRSPYP